MESVHSWGSMMAVRPAAGHEWQDLVREPFPEYVRPPITMQELAERVTRDSMIGVEVL